MTIDELILAGTILILALVGGISFAELQWRRTCRQKEDQEMRKHVRETYWGPK